MATLEAGAKKPNVKDYSWHSRVRSGKGVGEVVSDAVRQACEVLNLRHTEGLRVQLYLHFFIVLFPLLHFCM